MINALNTTKQILDVCCGGKMFYFDKHDDRVLFCDIRCIDTLLSDGRTFTIQPDVIADFTNLPFRHNSFKLVIFDPPHILRKSGKMSDLKLKYGILQNNWRDMISKGFAECFRVLSNDGVLIFKWSETDIRLDDILQLTPQRPVFGHKSGKASKTHWLCFVKG